MTMRRAVICAGDVSDNARGVKLCDEVALGKMGLNRG
ncbi:hypothetical protein F4695_001847 [Rhizobium soli]|uniref:Uncharacterized protein n=1 Tax=Rhizobium soli TaxID=424798 RepID=A0A7X0JJ27_9HYPH|nr:hypothetical protein [Rhizobium soli]